MATFLCFGEEGGILIGGYNPRVLRQVLSNWRTQCFARSLADSLKSAVGSRPRSGGQSKDGRSRIEI